MFVSQLRTSGAGPVSLVRHNEPWSYFKGTTAPPAGWQTLPDGQLGPAWASGPGGFGYGDGDDTTILTDMRGNYTTLYIRQTFTLDTAPDPLQRLTLVVDWDDGFIAWLDGVEIARSPNAPGAPGTEPPHTATSNPPNHEASAGAGGNPPARFDLGPVGDRLAAGPHVLAVMGLNGTLGSSDFTLIVDLEMEGSEALVSGTFLTRSTTSPIEATGLLTLPDGARVTVNGDPVAFDLATGGWAAELQPVPGWNEWYVAGLDAQGRLLGWTNHVIVYDPAPIMVSGPITTNTTWSPPGSVVHVIADVTVEPSARLDIAAGVVVLLDPGVSIVVRPDARLRTLGTAEQPVRFLPADGSSSWGALMGQGSNAIVQLQYAEVAAGQVLAQDGARLWIQDSYLHDLHDGRRLFVGTTDAQQLVLQRTHVARYDQMRFANTPVRIEDCLFEEVNADATDFADSANAIVARTTYRLGHGANTDAIDLGQTPGLRVQQCLIRDFPDKAISVADRADGVTIRDSLIYRCGTGVAVYASTNTLIEGSTVSECGLGLHLYQRPGFAGPGQAQGTNLIVWGNATNVLVTDGAQLELAYSEVQGSEVFPGPGNLNIDPMFIDPASGDFRLATASPVRGAGLDGADMGVTLPVGGIPPAPWALAALVTNTDTIVLEWQEDADNEAGFEIQVSTDKVSWQTLGNTGPNQTAFVHAFPLPELTHYYRVRATNSSGASPFSNLAAARATGKVTIVGGPLAASTNWGPQLGRILVSTTVTVPDGLSLTLEPGTLVQLTNNASLVAEAGGRIELAGTAEEPVRLQPAPGVEHWGELSAKGTNAWLIIRHADIGGGQTTLYDGATGLWEDSVFHDYVLTEGGTIFTQPILLSQFASPSTIRRCQVRNYYEVLLRNSQMLVEECLFEHMIGDALDFDGALPGTLVRHCTFRHGNRSNVDAIDVGNDGSRVSRQVVIEGCLMYDFPFDKGVSIGERAEGITVTNCLIHHVSRGVQVKDTATAIVADCTITRSEIGIHCFEKIRGTGGGRATNTFNNILWGNTNAFALETTSELVIHHSDLQATNWPGLGNIDADPLFVNPEAGDYRLQPGSPCLGTGENGADMGPAFPVGAKFAPSHPAFDAVLYDAAGVTLIFYADSERSYQLQWSHDPVSGPWTKLADIVPPSQPARVSVTDPNPDSSRRFYRLVALPLP